MSADLAVLSEFLDEYKDTINSRIASYDSPSEDDILDAIYQTYREAKIKHARAMSPIYIHRIPRTLGLKV